MKSRKLLKIIAALVAFMLIGIILFVANAFVGNPISAKLADRAIHKYVERNYSFIDPVVEETYYNFKNASYAARVSSSQNIDIHFLVYARNGKVLRDDYDSYVLGKFNTWQRLSDEYSALAKALVARELGYINNRTMVMYDKETLENPDLFELGMTFDKSLPLSTEVMLRLELTDSSIEHSAKLLTDAHNMFKKNGCYFTKYSLYSEAPGVDLMINDVTPEAIESEELLSLLRMAEKGQDASGIRVFKKGNN
ncbi:hypothetical protein EJF36_11940 [Bacillus sp. HMF5848]|uniref:YfjL-like protein n=1 Tax=Bacillus sp. HMF5848 TaxID=2495421 RepID=UPI000F7B3E38|nr:hypothetical protein [Bacillus sp. HMF5848]RSK27530.1 hypothetical protein EJF36_11940 [Bacillus sp. HMF5848]